jgi:hypothetical protein
VAGRTKSPPKATTEALTNVMATRLNCISLLLVGMATSPNSRSDVCPVPGRGVSTVDRNPPSQGEGLAPTAALAGTNSRTTPAPSSR